MTVFKYSSLTALAEDGEKYKSKCPSDTSWTGGEPIDKVISTLKNGGDIKIAQEAKKYLDDFSVNIFTEVPIHKPSPFGGRFIIPEAILGWPEPARMLTRDMDDAAPLTVFFSNTCSGGIDKNKMIKRGMAIMAFVMAMSYVRSVKVTYFSELGGTDGWTNIMFDVPTSPMSLAEAAYCMGSLSLTRGLVYGVGYGKDVGFHGDWANHYLRMGGDKRSENYIKFLRSSLGAKHDDVILGSVYMDDPLIKDPMLWLKTTLETYVGEKQ